MHVYGHAGDLIGSMYCVFMVCYVKRIAVAAARKLRERGGEREGEGGRESGGRERERGRGERGRVREREREREGGGRVGVRMQ